MTQTRMSTRITAMCLAVPDRTSTGPSTSLLGHHPQRVQCEECPQQYSIDYEPSDAELISDFEHRLLIAAQKLVNSSHPIHSAFLKIDEV